MHKTWPALRNIGLTPTRTHSISGLKSRVDIFELKMIVKSGLDIFYFEIQQAPSELLLPSASAEKSAQKG